MASGAPGALELRRLFAPVEMWCREYRQGGSTRQISGINTRHRAHMLDDRASRAISRYQGRHLSSSGLTLGTPLHANTQPGNGRAFAPAFGVGGM